MVQAEDPQQTEVQGADLIQKHATDQLKLVRQAKEMLHANTFLTLCFSISTHATPGTHPLTLLVSAYLYTLSNASGMVPSSPYWTVICCLCLTIRLP